MRSLLVVALLVGPALAQSPAPGPSPSAAPKISEDAIPLSYRRVLAALRDRKPEPPLTAPLRFGRPERPDWSTVKVREIRASGKGFVLLLEDDPKEYKLGDEVRGRKLVELTADEAAFDEGGERRRVKMRRTALPTVLVRSVKQIEGEWAAFLEGERRPVYPGDVVRTWRVVSIDEGGVTFQIGNEQRKIAPKPVKPPFPELAFNGMVDMPTGRVVLMKGRRDPVKVGDVVDGAKIVDIQARQVTVEHFGEKRIVPIR
jgi:hypothetical protein